MARPHRLFCALAPLAALLLLLNLAVVALPLKPLDPYNSITEHVNVSRRDLPGTSSGGSAAACIDLSRLLPPNSVRLNARSTSARNLANTLSTPSCIVLPTSTAQVSIAMGSIYRHAARYAVQAGGHTGMEGWDTVADGVLLDFSKFNGIDYRSGAPSVSLSPGARWSEVYARLSPYGVSVLGGRQGDVGMGLLLGGGLSFLSPRYGYVSDGLVEVDVVLVNGTVVTANPERNVDLFRATKGGGGRFGIVTRYETRTIATGTPTDKRWYGGSLYYNEASIPALLSAVDALIASPDDPSSVLLASFGMMKQPQPTFLASLQLYYTGDRAAFERYFAPILSVAKPASSNLAFLSYDDMTKQTPVGYEGKRAYKWYGQSTRPGGSRLSNMWMTYRAFVAENLDVLELSFFSITPIKTTQTAASYGQGGSIISPPRGVNFAAAQHSDYLRSSLTTFPPSLDAARAALGQKWSAIVGAAAEGLPLFLNEADESQVPLATYGAYAEARRTYARYDPARFAVRYQNGPQGL